MGWIVSRWTTGWTRVSNEKAMKRLPQLTGLVNVVVLVLLLGDTDVGGTSLSLTLGGGVLVSGPLLVELGLVLGVHLLLVLSGDDGSSSGGVLGR